ncbi:uncharacterized protein LOC110861814 [Folsomia candida]|uniref:Uncharacterized protein n=1 Tax=Folsomia candida TaxID=158441 RepID=A0A226CZZ3_FOLCA|nr:uncharacterized protein LOC110861814 [Folsomia candida]OXA38529.1 hypothetical protein Fcan01_26731 [Folsomia candida]
MNLTAIKSLFIPATKLLAFILSQLFVHLGHSYHFLLNLNLNFPPLNPPSSLLEMQEYEVTYTSSGTSSFPPSSSGSSPIWLPQPPPASPPLASMFNAPDYNCLSPAPSTRPASRMRDSREWTSSKNRRKSSSSTINIIKLEEEEEGDDDVMQGEGHYLPPFNLHDDTGSVTLVSAGDKSPPPSPTKMFAEAFRHIRKLNHLMENDATLRVVVMDLQAVNLDLLKAQEALEFRRNKRKPVNRRVF